MYGKICFLFYYSICENFKMLVLKIWITQSLLSEGVRRYNDTSHTAYAVPYSVREGFFIVLAIYQLSAYSFLNLSHRGTITKQTIAPRAATPVQTRIVTPQLKLSARAATP